MDSAAGQQLLHRDGEERRQGTREKINENTAIFGPMDPTVTLIKGPCILADFDLLHTYYEIVAVLLFDTLKNDYAGLQ